MNTEAGDNTSNRNGIPAVEPWPDVVNGKELLDELVVVVKQFVVLPRWAAEALALWILHTFAYELRDVSAYLGVESPEKRCGKTTLLTVLGELVNRPVVASNISSPAFFRVIQQTKPTLLIDEADTFLQGNDELRGILNSGYTRKTAFVWRVSQEGGGQRTEVGGQRSEGGGQRSEGGGQREGGGQGRKGGASQYEVKAVKFSCWCPKVMAAIGRLPETLADRCIVIRMQRKLGDEKCDSTRNLDARAMTRRCVRFVRDNAGTISGAEPNIPESLNDRAADIWAPLFALADLAGEDWPKKARAAAISLSMGAQESSAIGALLFDLFAVFSMSKQKRLFTRTLVYGLNTLFTERPWMEGLKKGEATERWLSFQLRPYGIKPKTMRIKNKRAKGYLFEEFRDIFKRYIPRSEIDALRAEIVEDAEARGAGVGGQRAEAGGQVGERRSAGQ
jgi:hypothetical protein